MTQVSTDGLISTMWSIHTMKHYSVLQRKKIVARVLIQITLKKLNTPVIKRQILYDSTYMRYLEYSNLQTQKENDSCQGLGVAGRG